MSQRKIKPVVTLLMLVAIISIYGCHTTQRSGDKTNTGPSEDIERLAFEDALKEDSTAAYAKFLHDYPKSILAVQAQSRLLAIETRDWEYAYKTDTLDAYINFHMSHREARPDELRERLLSLVGALGTVIGGDLTEHNSYLKTANAVEWHNLAIRYGESFGGTGSSVRSGALVGLLGAPGSRATCIGGVCLPYPDSGTISTTGSVASMVFDDDLKPTVATHAEVTYVLIPETGSTLVFSADSDGLHHISGGGIVLTCTKGTAVNIYN